MANLNETVNADRVHIGIFGSRNAGKSSLINAITNQEIAVVSDVKGTTTDPVSKAMELLPLGPVVIIDTPGFDDDDKFLGEKRVDRVKKVLNKVDIAVLVIDGNSGVGLYDLKLEEILIEKNIPYVIAINKCDLIETKESGLSDKKYENIISNFEKIKEKNKILYISAKKKFGIEELKEIIAKLKPTNNKSIVGDIVKKGDLIILVTPIDESAPKGRMILPQVQVLRNILDCNATALFTKETELKQLLQSLGRKPDFVITDSQVFKVVDEIVEDDIPLTSFSILLARYKGFLKVALDGVKNIDTIKDGDRILISEGCTHHRQCNDIGTTKIPKLLEKITGAKVNIETSSGTEFPDDLKKYKMIIHCGGCMVNDREMLYRMKCASDAGVPFTNYGIFIAMAHGILDRSVKDVPIK